MRNKFVNPNQENLLTSGWPVLCLTGRMEMNLRTDSSTLEHLLDRFKESAFDINNTERFLKALCSLSNQIAGWATETDDPGLGKMLRVEFGVLFEVCKNVEHAEKPIQLEQCVSVIMASLQRIRERQTGYKTLRSSIYRESGKLVS